MGWDLCARAEEELDASGWLDYGRRAGGHRRTLSVVYTFRELRQEQRVAGRARGAASAMALGSGSSPKPVLEPATARGRKRHSSAVVQRIQT